MKNNLKEMEEYVMVFKASLLREIGYFQGLSFETKNYLEIILAPKNNKFMQRRMVESDPSYKQLIPYCILRYNETIFTYTRGKLQGEKRLLGNYSIGVGGHISVYDPSLFGTTYEQGLYRELSEEIEIQGKYQQRAVALINDDTDEVGKVHFGIIHVFTLEEPLVRSKEKSITKAEFLSVKQLRKHIHKFEHWSKICIDEIEKLFVI